MAQLKEDNLKASLKVLEEFINAVNDKNISDFSEKIENAKKAMEMLRKNLGKFRCDVGGSSKEMEIILGCAGKTPAIPSSWV